MNRPALTWILAVLLAAAFLLALPASLRAALERGQFYLFTERFFADIPARLMGPGRFRFVLQPIMAILLGIREGRAQSSGKSTSSGSEKARISFRALANLLMVAILLDLVFQWIIFGIAYPGAALVVGPVLITCPYLLARLFAQQRRSSHATR